MTNAVADFGASAAQLDAPSGQSAIPLAAKPRRRASAKRDQAPAAQFKLNAFDAIPAHERAVIEAAKAILSAHWRCAEASACNDTLAGELARMHLSGIGHECFAVMFLDAQNRLIEFKVMFTGTLKQTAVYPREVARMALQLNAAAVILAHNHPSGNPEPSTQDERLTYTMKNVLSCVDVGLLDHLVVGVDRVVSMSARGMM